MFFSLPHSDVLSRTIGAVLSGSAAGIIGITGWWGGALFYLVTYTIQSLLIVYKAGDSISSLFRGESRLSLYFQDPSEPLYEQGLLIGVMTYVMFWILMYDITHVFS